MKITKTSAGSAIFIKNPEDPNEILLAKRSLHKKRFPGYWEFPGGAIEDCESSEDCIRREIKEELHSEILDLKFVFTDLYYYNDTRYIVFIYEGYIDLAHIQVNELEIEKYEMVHRSSIFKYETYPRIREQIEQYFEFRGTK